MIRPLRSLLDRRAAAPTSRVTALTIVASLALPLLVLPLPGAAQDLFIEGGTVHPIDGEPFDGHVAIVDGRIQALGPDVAAPEGAARIDARGRHVYPGLFDAMSQIGLVEVSSISATVDTSELGRYNPHLLAATAIHPDSEVIPVTRANGVTHSLVAPAASGDALLPGQASVVHLDGWTVEEMAIEPRAGMVLAWPEIETRTFDFATFSVKQKPFEEARREAEKKLDELRDWLDAARHYRQATEAGSERLERDLELEALAGVLDGRQKVLVQVASRRGIESALDFADEQGLEIVLVGADQAWQLSERIAEAGVPVILGLVQTLPDDDDDPFDGSFRNASLLRESGVEIAFASGVGSGAGPSGPHSARALPYEAATAVAFGLPREEALRALTLAPAEILGVADRIGSLTPGKLANLIVTDGDPLEITTRVEHVVIGGRSVPSENRHSRLYERYRSRPTDD